MEPLTEEAEELRLRQVHQYLSLNRSGRNDRKSLLEISASRKTSPNTALTAFAQLVTLRLGAQRAIISLVDRNQQFSLAESTQALDLSDTERGDWLWMGCSGSTSRPEALCTRTIKAPLPAQGYAFFCVPDLLNDPTFKTLSYVKQHPNFRFYAGTPLISREGFRIGTLFIIDDRSRDTGLDASEIAFLGIMAENVMQYLETQRESEERKRISLMSKGLAAFTEGRHRIPNEWKISPEKDTGTSDIHATNIDVRRDSPDNEAAKTVPLNTPAGFKIPEDDPISPSRVIDLNGEHQTHASILARASNLLRESLDVDYTIFLSTKPQKSLPVQDTKSSEGSMTEKFPSHVNGILRSKRKDACVLSFSTKSCSSSSGDELSSSEFNVMRLSMVKRMVKKYPKGYLWTFDEKGTVVQVEDEPLELNSDSPSSDLSSDTEAEEGTSSRETEFDALRTCFLGVRQILYAPIVDPATSCNIAACFAVSLHEVPVFNTEIEVAFARAFLNNVAVEWDRITVSIADRQKGDFLSSISHEFRSPLHGILASTELLADSDLNTFQRGLCDTVLSCGSTLLNTVSHVLDFTKVNNFHHQPPENQDKSDAVTSMEVITSYENTTRIETLPSIGLYSNVDVASICEAVVQTVCAGFMHDQKFLGSHIQDVSKAVTVVLDISFGDWMFVCSPGAVQRILMNLVGNALKYTRAGWVKIELKLSNSRDQGRKDGESQILTMVVSDTGIGISEDFLRHKLYIPFSQESRLAPGTGLGLSMVKKMVHGLQGEIMINSQQNQGTQAIVHIPLIRAAQATVSPSISFSNADSTNNPISVLREKCNKKVVALYGFIAQSLLRESIELYVTRWYCFNIVEDIKLADFIIVDESDLGSLISQLGENNSSCRVVVLRSASAKQAADSVETDTVLKPIGPHRLAKGLFNSWTRKQEELESFHDHQLDGSTLTHRPIVPEQIEDLPKMRINNASTIKRPENSKRDTSPVGKALPLRASGDQRLVDKQVSTSVNFSVKLPQRQILVVDDNPINTKLLRAYLKKLGYERVLVAENGLEAFDTIEQNVVDLIFMDISMPLCDGNESTRRIRKFEKQRNKLHDNSSPTLKPTFIIALTGQASTWDRDQAFASGMNYFATKPLSLTQLKRLLAEWELKGSIDPHQSP